MINVRFDFILGGQPDVVTASYPVSDEEIFSSWFNKEKLSGKDQILDAALRDGRIQEDPAKPGEGVYLHRFVNPATGKAVLSQEIADVTTIYAIPRLTLLFYPKW